MPEGRLIQGDLGDAARLESALRAGAIDAVMHFAAFTSVPESVTEPARYYRNNVVGALNLLDAMRAAGVGKIVFSSTAAVYGVPDEVPIPETAPTRPINPYGFTKLAIERALADYARPTASARPRSATSTPAAPRTTRRSARTTGPRRT